MCLWDHECLSSDWCPARCREESHISSDRWGGENKGSASSERVLEGQPLGFPWRGLLNLGRNTETLSLVRLHQESSGPAVTEASVGTMVREAVGGGSGVICVRVQVVFVQGCRPGRHTALQSFCLNKDVIVTSLKCS